MFLGYFTLLQTFTEVDQSGSGTVLALDQAQHSRSVDRLLWLIPWVVIRKV